MDLSNLANTPGARHAKKRVGRGCGSGLGKTSTRGHKGQNARKGHKQKLGFEGGQMPLVRRLPKRGFNNARFQTKALGVNVLTLEKLFNAGDEITIETLAAKGLSDNKRPLVKILATGELTKSLTVKVPCSAAAKAKIEAAGGTVVA
jgi:large subunit ribosomal protein L15